MTVTTETPTKVLDAALGLWAEKGYAAGTMRELARRAEMSMSALYALFATKEDVVLALYAELNRRAAEAFQAADRGETDLAVLFRRFLETKLAVVGPWRAALGSLLGEAVDTASAISPFSSRSGRVLDESLARLRAIVVRSGAAVGHEDELARVLWLVHAAVLAHWLRDESEGGRRTQRIVAALAAACRLLPMAAILPTLCEVLGSVADLVRPPAQPAPAPERIEVAAPTRECDVAVVGGGPVGAVYASLLKRRRPGTRVALLERAVEPGHKIGESTLSGFCKAVRTIGIPKEAMRALFYPKNGLGFHHVDETVADVAQAPEYVLETFDETYQVERRVLDSLLLEQAQRLGVDVVQGARVALDRSSLGSAGNTLAYDVGSRPYRLRSSLVVDATGPAGLLSRRFGWHSTEGLPFQTGSVWTYFTGISGFQEGRGWRGRSQFPRDEYTQHLCFREGWLWHIPLVSWQHAPTANLRRALSALMDDPVPSRRQLVEAYGCPAEDIVSVGLVVRSDRDRLLVEDPRAGFEAYRRRYPAIDRLLAGARQLDDHYGTGSPFFSRLAFRGHSRQMAGDGWLLAGDAAFFVDPLISPGLTGGVAGAFQAVEATVAALDSGRSDAAAFADYERFMHALHEALERDNQLVYMSFNHPEAMALVQRFQEVDARRHFLDHGGDDYALPDTNVWGILDPAYQELQVAAHAILREEEEAVGREVPVGEQSLRDYDPAVRRLRELLGPYVEAHRDLTPYARDNEQNRRQAC